MSLSGINNSGYNPAQMTQKMNDRFHAADADQNGSLTKTELSNALQAEGMDTAKVDRMFDRMDVNKDGEVSLQEHQDMTKAMQERMEKFVGAGDVGNREGFDTVTTLLESLQTDMPDTDDQEKLQNALEKLKTTSASQEELSESVSLLNTILPPVYIRV